MDESLLNQLSGQKKKAVEQEKPKPKKQYFKSGECHGCQYKATAYCWRNCSMNVWKEQRDWC